MDALTVIERCALIAQCTEEPGFITRPFQSPALREAQRLVREWMESAGMRVWTDAAENVHGVYGDGPRLMIGSHLDSVPHAGAYDGVLGVMIAIALVERRPPCAVEVVAFSEEEVSFAGSRAVVADPAFDARAYLEFHIEQGPVLDAAGLPLAAVTAIVGQSRRRIRFIGKAGHAGTTPMAMRHDALAGAAEWIGMVERQAAVTPELVATVGKIDVSPSAANVIAGEAAATLDVRHASDTMRRQAVDSLLLAATQVGQARGLRVQSESLLEQAAVPLNSTPAQQAIEAVGYPVHRMVSGAGHDAMILAQRVPASMVFLRSPGGVSHHPDETVLPEDVDAALKVGMRLLEQPW
jgi:allantoate deiminase